MSLDRSNRWILITNTQQAGTKWLGTLLAADINVAYRHNRVSLSEGGSVFARHIQGVTYLPGLENIEVQPSKFTVADHFRHLEANVRCTVYIHSDAWQPASFLANIAQYPSQISVLESRNFRIRNMVMDPIRALDAMDRMLSMFSRRGTTIPPLPLSQAVYDHLRPEHLREWSEDDLFLRGLLFLANAFARDATLAQQSGITSMAFDHLFSDRSALLTEIADLSDGDITIPERKLDEMLHPRFAHRLRDHETLSNVPVADGLRERDILTEGETYYRALSAWRQRVTSIVYTAYGVFDAYRRFGYRFDYTERPSQADLFSFATLPLRHGWPELSLAPEVHAFIRKASTRRRSSTSSPAA